MKQHVALRIGGPLVYAAALAVYAIGHGLPLTRYRLLVWILLALLAVSLADLRRWARGVVVEWLPFVLILFVYDQLRGIADGLLMPAHTYGPIRADLRLFDGTLPTPWLQQHLWSGPGHLHWYDYGVWLVYLSHFFGTLLVAGALWLFAPHRFRRWVAMVSLLAMLGFATYTLYPATPPWLASAQGDIPQSGRLIAEIWRHLSFEPFQPMFEKGTHYANNVAAMPSLHAAYSMLIMLFLWPWARWRWRFVLALYPPAMGFALVYTGEHYVIDILAGWVYAAVAFLVVERVAALLESRGRVVRPGYRPEPAPEQT